MDEQNLHALFQNFDTDNSGTITKQNIITAMSKMGNDINQAELDQTMSKHDMKLDGEISFSEFKAMMYDIHDINRYHDIN